MVLMLFTVSRSVFGGGVDKLFPDDCGRNDGQFFLIDDAKVLGVRTNRLAESSFTANTELVIGLFTSSNRVLNDKMKLNN
jgi:hypothetical protein